MGLLMNTQVLLDKSPCRSLYGYRLAASILKSDRSFAAPLDDVDSKTLRNDGKHLAIRAVSYFNRLAIFRYIQNRVCGPPHKLAGTFSTAQNSLL